MERRIYDDLMMFLGCSENVPDDALKIFSGCSGELRGLVDQVGLVGLMGLLGPMGLILPGGFNGKGGHRVLFCVRAGIKNFLSFQRTQK